VNDDDDDEVNDGVTTMSVLVGVLIDGMDAVDVTVIECRIVKSDISCIN
jgi:hypothetical protein